MVQRHRLDSLVFEVCVSIAVVFMLYTVMITFVYPHTDAQKSIAEVQPAPSPASPAATPVLTPAAAPAPAPAVAEPPVSRPAASPAAPPATRYLVDAGVFRILSNARGVVAHLPEPMQARAEITPLKMHGETVYRVRIRVANKKDADTLSVGLHRDANLEARVTALR